ncbi:MAG: hypothetical protein NVS2B9_16180 [Myxococcales bacterium]
MRKTTLPAALLLVLAAACGKSAQVRASLTDAPIDNVSVFQVTISEVRFHNDGDEIENDGELKTSTAGTAASHKDADDDGARGKGWVVLCTGAQTYDLMKLRPDPTGKKVYAGLCGSNTVTVPTGKVDEFWLDVTQIHIEFTNGTKLDYTPVHGKGSGLKIEVEDDLNKTNDLELKVDFDAASSLIANLDGTFTVKPKLLEIH